jgi:hypothetical protein
MGLKRLSFSVACTAASLPTHKNRRESRRAIWTATSALGASSAESGVRSFHRPLYFHGCLPAWTSQSHTHRKKWYTSPSSYSILQRTTETTSRIAHATTHRSSADHNNSDDVRAPEEET